MKPSHFTVISRQAPDGTYEIQCHCKAVFTAKLNKVVRCPECGASEPGENIVREHYATKR